MSEDLTPGQTLLVWGLLARQGVAAQADIMPAVKKADREALERGKLVTATKRSRALWLKLEDAGWSWAAQHLRDPLPEAQRALHGIMTRLHDHLAGSGETLADFIGAAPEEIAEAPAPAKQPRPKPPARPRAATSTKATKRKEPSPTAMRKRLEAAYLAVTGGRKNESAHLSRVRAELAGLDRSTVDAALYRVLTGDKKARLMRLNNPKAIDAAEEAAAFNPSGEPFHLLWIEA